MKKIVLSQFVILLAGTLFAWANFGIELVSWLNKRACTLGCPVAPLTNPFLTPCFYGAIFFTAAFVLSAVILKKVQKS
jgi:hypothetical protein